MEKFIKSPNGFKIGIGVEYAMVIGLSVLLAWFATQPLVGLENAPLIVLIAIVIIVVGFSLSKKYDPTKALIGQVMALVPIPTVLCVVFGGGDSIKKGVLTPLIVLGIGLIVTACVSLVADLFVEKKKSFFTIVAIIIGCEVLAICLKKLEFNLGRMIAELIIGGILAACWYDSVATEPRTMHGFAESCVMPIHAPFEIAKKAYKKIKGG